MTHASSADGGTRRRWIVLAAAMLGQLPVSMLLFGLPALAPVLHADLGLTLTQFGFAIGALNLGFTAAVLPWGMAADRFGERRMATAGLTLSVGAILLLATSTSYAQLLVFAVLAGTVASCSHPAGSIAVMRSFPAHQRSFAYAIRHTATPLGGLVAATALPAIAGLHHRPFGASPHGLAIGSVAIVAVVAAIAVAVVLPSREPRPGRGNGDHVAAPRPSLRQPRDVVRISLAASTLGMVQLASTGFLVLYLHDERHVSAGLAAGALAVVQGLAIVVRPLEGIVADRIGSRVLPLRATAAVLVLALPLLAIVAGRGAGDRITVAAAALLALVGVIASGWNGVAVAAVAERARADGVGGATALLTAMLAGTNTIAPALFAALVAGTSWPIAFALLAAIPASGVALLAGVRPAGPPRRVRAQPEAELPA